MGSDSNVWHQVHAQREDGVAAMFLIRDVQPRTDQPKIFVVELPYAVTDLSGQPDAAAYRRLSAFQEQWLEPACAALGWTFVAWKCDEGDHEHGEYGGEHDHVHTDDCDHDHVHTDDCDHDHDHDTTALGIPVVE